MSDFLTFVVEDFDWEVHLGRYSGKFHVYDNKTRVGLFGGVVPVGPDDEMRQATHRAIKDKLIDAIAGMRNV